MRRETLREALGSLVFLAALAWVIFLMLSL
jgi:hypothetical protein